MSDDAEGANDAAATIARPAAVDNAPAVDMLTRLVLDVPSDVADRLLLRRMAVNSVGDCVSWQFDAMVLLLSRGLTSLLE